VYDGDITGSPGIFSFVIYGTTSVLDEYIIDMRSQQKTPIYFVGLYAYTEMLKRPEWAGWKIVIHTTQETIDKNPKAFDYFKANGVIIGIVRLSDDLSHNGILRVSRYHPMFVNTGVVNVRDADTLFDAYLYQIINNVKNPLADTLHNKYPTFDEKMRYLTTTPDILAFIENLSNWESLFLERVSVKGASIFFSYDSPYTLDKNLNINRNNDMWTGTNKEYQSALYNSHIRFLAGMLTKTSGFTLPLDLWNPGLKNFVKTLVEKTTGNVEKAYSSVINTTNAETDKKYRLNTNMSRAMTTVDEYYLTYIIYKWAKKEKHANFFYANYVHPSVMRFRNKYMEAKGLAYDLSSKTYIQKDGEPINKFDMEICKYTGGIAVRRAGYEHGDIQHMFLEVPALQLEPEFFINILEGSKRVSNIPKVRAVATTAWGAPTRDVPSEPRHFPPWVPTYRIGGGAKTRKNKYTQKRRRASTRNRRSKSQG
jgi:hypothetical protein